LRDPVAPKATNGGRVGDFTPISGLIGGLLIGLAVALTLLLNGRIAGISGIVSGLVNPKAGDTGWRVAFAIGLPLGALAYILMVGGRRRWTCSRPRLPS
jgi:uncharacterized membrane protein YedE/YeeE